VLPRCANCYALHPEGWRASENAQKTLAAFDRHEVEAGETENCVVVTEGTHVSCAKEDDAWVTITHHSET
jgi:hypothetical protein